MAPVIRPDRVAIYTRWSREDQGQGTTPQEQMERCSLYVRSQGWEVNPDLIFTDDGESGATLQRPAVRRLREAVRAGKVDCCVTYRVDRLSRNIADAVDLVLREWRAGSESPRCHYKSATEQIDTTTPLGKMLFVLLSSFADWERETIKLRTSAGLRRRVSEGSLYGSPAPYGYRRAGKARLEPDPDRAPVVVRIFELVRGEGLGITAVAFRLNQEGVPAARGGLWQRAVVRQILTNPIYCGRLVYGRRQVNPLHRDDPSQPRIRPARPHVVAEAKTVPALVSPELWAEVQQLIGARAARVRTMGARSICGDHLLTGIARCRCGGPMSIHHATAHGYLHLYYKCSRWFNKGPGACSARLIPAAEAERQVVAAVKAHWGDPTHREPFFRRMEAGFDRELGQAGERLTTARTARVRLEARVEPQLARIRADYRAGLLTPQEMRANQADLEAERQQAAALVERLEAEMAQLQAAAGARSTLADAARRVENWEALTPEQQKQVLGLLLQRVTLSRSPGWAAPVEIEIAWR